MQVFGSNLFCGLLHSKLRTYRLSFQVINCESFSDIEAISNSDGELPVAVIQCSIDLNITSMLSRFRSGLVLVWTRRNCTVALASSKNLKELLNTT
jgi:hypothetical protein